MFIRGRKLNTQSYFKVPKDIRLNTTHFFITKIQNKRELQQIALKHSSDISTNHYIKIHKKMYYWTIFNDVSVYDATLGSDNLLRFRKNHSNI